jgi:eukaryotic-like serine/threonine-protein kinase
VERTGGGGRGAGAPVRSVGHIRIVGTLGVGGMGDVYVGWDETLKRRVALKAIRREQRMRPDVKGRFLREARILSQLDHPNICRIYDYVEGTDRDYLVLELVEGETLSKAIRRGLDGPRRLEIAERIAEALAAAHAKGVVHRDLKPHNVMLADSGEVKVLDFGIARAAGVEDEGAPEAGALLDPAPLHPAASEPEARGGGDSAEAPLAADPDTEPDTGATVVQGPAPLWSPEELAAAEAREPGSEGLGDPGDSRSWTVHGSLLGSPGYLSPEQARGHAATTASDMYAFGLVLQELFTGTPAQPPDLGTAELVRRARHAERLPLEGVRSDVAALIGRLLDPAAAARPTAVEALARLRWIRDRPRRRLVRGVAAAVLLVLVLGGVKYTLDLKAARDVAERHRAQAEDLIGFMLGDLRDKLAGVGRLELLDDVGDKALDYYESLPVEDRTDAELFRRSQALRQIGEVRIAQGNLPAAMEALEESGRLTEALVARDPRHTEWLLGLGHCHFWKGHVHWLQDDFPAARAHFESYRELTDRLIAIEPGETEWRLERGYADNNLAAVHEVLGEPDAAFASLQHSLTIKEDLLRADPDNVEWRRSLATGLSWQGSMLIARGDLVAAAESFGRERRIRQALLADDPDNAEDRVLLAVNASHTGDLALSRGDLAAGRRAIAESRELYGRLVRHDPANTRWRRGLAVTHLQLAELELVADDAHAAAGPLADAEEILTGLVAQDASNGNWQRMLARAWTLRGRAALATGRPGEARTAARQAQESLESLSAGSEERALIVEDLAASLLVLGQALAANGDAAAARASWQRADDILESELADSQPVELLALRAMVLPHLDRMTEAEAIVRRLTHSGYARPDLLRLSAQHGLVAVGSEVGRDFGERPAVPHP